MPFRAAPVPNHYKLIKKYVHNSNTVYQPSSIDMTTGQITFSSPHGLTANQVLSLAFNQDVNLNYVPNEWFTNTDYLQVNSVVSPTVVTLCKGSGGTPSATFSSYATKASVDMTKIHFESQPPQITLSGFSTTRLFIRYILNTGKGDCYIQIPEINGLSWQGGATVFAAGIPMSWTATHSLYRHLRYEATIDISNNQHATILHNANQWYATSSPAWANNNAGIAWGSSLGQASSPTMKSILINNNSQPIINGSFIELYDAS